MMEKSSFAGEADFENKARLDKRYGNLPKIFQQRIDKFRKDDPDFRRTEVGEDYEMFCCEQAVIISQFLIKNMGKNQAFVAAKNFFNMSWDQRKKLFPKLDDQHTNHTIGRSLSLAIILIKQ